MNNTTTDNTATSWRDLESGLTFDQVGFMLNFESTALSDPADVAEYLLEAARGHVRQNRVDAQRFGHLQVPDGAAKVEHWEDDGTGNWVRQFSGASSVLQFPNFGSSVEVAIDGVQHEDGSVERFIDVYSDGSDGIQFTAEDARQLAGALIDAAAELDRLR